MKPALFTIGYEGRQLDEVVALLTAHRVDRVIDVRELPLSRRRGFSKTPLCAALAQHAIDYVHLREAGNPFRRIRHELDRAALLAQYRVHLAATRSVVARVADQARDHRAALLCYELAPDECHRSILAPRVARRLGATLVDL